MCSDYPNIEQCFTCKFKSPFWVSDIHINISTINFVPITLYVYTLFSDGKNLVTKSNLPQGRLRKTCVYAKDSLQL